MYTFNNNEKNYVIQTYNKKNCLIIKNIIIRFDTILYVIHFYILKFFVLI